MALPEDPRTERRSWQRMLSGRRLNLIRPGALDVEIGDIARGLARLSRWNGQTRGDHLFSVAQHSLLVVSLLTGRPRELCLAGLLHDAAEYVIGDLISPLKDILAAPYTEVETRIQAAVHERFGLPASLPKRQADVVKRADRQAAHLEAVHIAGFAAREGKGFFGPLPRRPYDRALLEPMAIPVVEEAFLKCFERLAGQSTRVSG